MLACPFGWRRIGSDLFADTAVRSSQPNLAKCAASCDDRPPCSLFEYHSGSGICNTFVQGVADVSYDAQAHGWLSCRRRAALPSFHGQRPVNTPPSLPRLPQTSCEAHGHPLCARDVRLRPNLLKARTGDAEQRWATCTAFFAGDPVRRPLTSADFKHIPKAGGTAVERLLGTRFQWHARMRNSKGIDRIFDDADHPFAALAAGIPFYTVLRHPIEREHPRLDSTK
jgi:hypothetical protein